MHIVFTPFQTKWLFKKPKSILNNELNLQKYSNKYIVGWNIQQKKLNNPKKLLKVTFVFRDRQK